MWQCGSVPGRATNLVIALGVILLLVVASLAGWAGIG